MILSSELPTGGRDDAVPLAETRAAPPRNAAAVAATRGGRLGDWAGRCSAEGGRRREGEPRDWLWHTGTTFRVRLFARDMTEMKN